MANNKNINNKNNNGKGNGGKGGGATNPYCTVCQKHTNHVADKCQNRVCTRCSKKGHSAHECPDRPVCTYCKKGGHVFADCRSRGSSGPADLDTAMEDVSNFPNYNDHTTYQNTYQAPQQQNSQKAHGLQMPVAPPVHPEKIWCRFCNSLSHNSAGCDNEAQQAVIDLMLDLPHNYCGHCKYKGHPKSVCLNPYPNAACLTCNVRGHGVENCLFNIKEGTIRSHHKFPLTKKKDSKTGTKRRRGSEDEEFIKAHCDALETQNKDQVLTEIVKSSHLENLTEKVMDVSEPKDKYNNIWSGIDLSLTIAEIQKYSYNSTYTFYRIIRAVQHLHFDWTIHCGFEGCKSECGIVDHKLNPVSKETHNGVYTDMSLNEQPVFLVCSCIHENWDRTMVWKKVMPKTTQTSTGYQTRIKRVKKYAADPQMRRVMKSYLKNGNYDSDDEDSDSG